MNSGAWITSSSIVGTMSKKLRWRVCACSQIRVTVRGKQVGQILVVLSKVHRVVIDDHLQSVEGRFPTGPIHLISVFDFFDRHVRLVACGFQFGECVVQIVLVEIAQSFSLAVLRAVAGEAVVGGIRLVRSEEEYEDAD